jgi:divalent metal cation (Fe/Co/Zn/Cd) transporter
VRRSASLVVGIALLAAGILLGLYGLFAILYGGDSGGSGDAYVMFGGREIDADLVGAIALLLAFLLLLAAIPLLKLERTLVKRLLIEPAE